MSDCPPGCRVNFNICLRSFIWMTARLVWFKDSQRKTYVNWNLRPLLVFEMFQRFSSLALSPTQFTTFFLDGASYVFHLLIKSTLLAGKDLLCLDNKQNNTWSLVDSEFLFSCSTRRLTSKRSELSANSSDIELNIMGFLQVSKPWSSSSWSWSSSSSYLNILSTDAFLLLLRLIFCFCFFLLSKFFFLARI